jgi:hypothetical protein
MSVSGTPGTGTITLGSAVSDFQSLASAYGGNATVDVVITDGTAWEVARNCTYTHSGTTLSRGTLEASSTGSALSLTSAAIVSVTGTAGRFNRFELLTSAITPGGRLTLESGVPVSASDQTSKTTVYYTPYQHNVIVLWDGTDWVPYTFTETSLALGTLTSGKNYDVFGYVSGGALTLESLVWTSDTARATAVTLQDGRYCKSGDKTRLLLGTFRTTSTTTTEDSGGGTTSQTGGKRFLCNVYNRVRRHLGVIDTTDSWSYTTNTTRQANNASGNKVELLIALPGFDVSARITATVATNTNSARWAKIGIGVDSTSTYSGLSSYAYSAATLSLSVNLSATYNAPLSEGYHYLAWLEKGADGTCVFWGDSGSAEQQSGMVAEVFA